MNDPIVEEVRGFRDDHAKKFNYDLDAICEDFVEHQKKCGHQIVRLKSKKIAIGIGTPLAGRPSHTTGHTGP